ncbi:MAG TPA: c-type cytochrome [Acidimicrobiia bacterium]
MRPATARSALGMALVLVLAACGDDGSTDGLSGSELATEIGCFACHTDSDTDLAPTLHGIWGTEVELEDGTRVVVDETYVRRSITDPGADVVEGFDARMPIFGLSESEVDRLVDYVRSLG